MFRWCLIATVVSSLGLAGCSSSKTVESHDESADNPNNPQYEIIPYLIDDDADAVVKFRAADWSRLQPLVTDVLSGDDRRGGDDTNSFVRAAEAGPVRFAGQLSGRDVELEHLTDERPGYLVYQPHAHSAQKACLTTDFPRVSFDRFGPDSGACCYRRMPRNNSPSNSTALSKGSPIARRRRNTASAWSLRLARSRPIRSRLASRTASTTVPKTFFTAADAGRGTVRRMGAH